MRHIDLFSGIGGFALAVEKVWPNSQHIFCDNDLYCQNLLKLRFPNSKIYGDIKEIKFIADSDWNGLQEQRQKQQTGRNRQLPEVDLLTGGFPCQPFSQAGKRRGTSDNRYLWPEMLRIIRLTSPRWVIAENVRGLLTMQNGLVFEQVCADLEDSGYEVQPVVIPAVAVNAPHRRDRIWFIAHALGNSADRKKKGGKLFKAPSKQKQDGPQYSSAGESLRTTPGRRSKRPEKNPVVAEASWDAESPRQPSSNEGSGQTQHGGAGTRSAQSSASHAKGQRDGGIASEERGIKKRPMEQDQSKGSEIRSEGKRRTGSLADSQSGESRKPTKQERWKNFERGSWERSWLETAAEFCGVDDGLPAELDGFELSKSKHRIERLKALGNAIVPEVAIRIMQAIKKSEMRLGRSSGRNSNGVLAANAAPEVDR
jgi:DNA (cytosine-5)-methyltransferase 1